MIKRIKFKLTFIFTLLSLSHSYPIIVFEGFNSQIDDPIEEAFTKQFIKSFSKREDIHTIPVFTFDDVNNIDDEKIKADFLEFEQEILSLPRKLDLLQNKKKLYHGVRWEDFQMKKIYEVDNICLYVAKLYLFAESSHIEVISFKILRDDDFMGIIDIHGEIVNDVIEPVPVHSRN